MKDKPLSRLANFDESSALIELSPVWKPDRFQQWKDEGVEILVRVLSGEDFFSPRPRNDDSVKGWYKLPKKMGPKEFQSHFPNYSFQYFANVGKRDKDLVSMRDYRLTGFRHAFALAHIFYEIRKLEGYDYNAETGQVLFDTWPGFPEGMPAYFTQVVDPERYNKEVADFEARKSDIVNESSSWIRLLPDGRIELWRESNRWDMGRRIKSVDIDEASEALTGLVEVARAENELKKADPVEYGLFKAEQKARSRKVLLGHHEDWVILSMDENHRGNAEIWGWGEKYDPETGAIIEQSRQEKAVYQDDSDETYDAIQAYSFNMFSELRSLLFKAVQSEAPDHYNKLFPLSVRLQILDFCFDEIQYRYKQKSGWKDEYEVRVFGHGEFMGNEIRPQIEYTLRRKETDISGVIHYEWSKVCADISEVEIVPEQEQLPAIDSSDGLRVVFTYADQVGEIVKKWEETQKLLYGADVEAQFEKQIRSLLTRMIAEEGFINGWTEQISLNPSTLEYSWQFHRRDFPIGDREPEVESATENPDNPHCAELSHLMSLVL